MKRKFTRLVALMLCFVFLLNMEALAIMAGETSFSTTAGRPEENDFSDSSYLSNDNDYVKYYINEQTGGFYIMPSASGFNRYKAESAALFEIDGAEYIFGRMYDGMETNFVMPFTNQYGTTQATWYIKDYEITQSLNIVRDEQSEGSYAVVVAYDVLKNGAPAELGVRIVLDTSFGKILDQAIMASVHT